MAGNSYCFHRLTPESLYWLGWLATDGCVYRCNNSWRVQFELQALDQDCVRRLAFFIGSKQPKPNSYDQYRAALTNAIMGKRLWDLGIRERKSHTLVVADELVRSPYFWRGAFEGDGCYQEKKNDNLSVSLVSASKPFLEQFQAVFYPHGTLYPMGDSWAVASYCGNARRLLGRLYDGSYPHLTLERKQPIVLKWNR